MTRPEDDDLGTPNFVEQSAYHVADIEAFVTRASDQIAQLERAVRTAEERAKRAEDANESLVKLLTLVQETAESTMTAARAASAQLGADAERRAEEIVEQARTEAASIYEHVRSAIETDYSAFEATINDARSQRSG